jgi:hypothetical protein
MKMLVRFVGLVAFLCAITAMNSNSFAQSASCANCGRTHAQIMSTGHAPSCKYYVATKTNSSQSSSPSGNSSGNATDALIMGVMNAIINSGNENAAEKEEAEKREAELAAQRAAEEEKKKAAEEKVKNDKLDKSYKPLGNTELEYKQLDKSPGFTPVSFNCKITSHSGQIKVRKPNGDVYVLGDGQNIEIQIGDVIATGSDGRIKIHFAFETGGKDMTIDKNTKVRIVKGEDGIQQPELFDGNLHVSNSVMDKVEEAYEREKAIISNKLKKKFEIRFPSGALAVRGTDFTVSASPQNGTEVNVMEGSVELKGIGNEDPIIIEAGFKGNITLLGEISGPVKIDMSTIEKWWEEK